MPLLCAVYTNNNRALNAQIPLYIFAPLVLDACVRHLGADDTHVCSAAVDTLHALVKSMDARQQLDQLYALRHAVQQLTGTTTTGTRRLTPVAGLHHDKGVRSPSVSAASALAI